LVALIRRLEWQSPLLIQSGQLDPFDRIMPNLSQFYDPVKEASHRGDITLRCGFAHAPLQRAIESVNICGQDVRNPALRGKVRELVE
jgi:hypothetical protein